MARTAPPHSFVIRALGISGWDGADAVVLAALATEAPLLLIGPHGSAKSLLLTRLINGAGAFEVGGPAGDNGLSGKKLVAEAYGTAVPIGGGALHGKDPRKVDPRGQARAREIALDLVRSGQAEEATVWLVWRPGDVEPRWTEIELRAARSV